MFSECGQYKKIQIDIISVIDEVYYFQSMFGRCNQFESERFLSTELSLKPDAINDF